MSKKYKVLYEDVQIGILSIEENSYVYVPNEEEIARLNKNGNRVLNCLREKIEAKTIPFFETRIIDAKRFKNVSVGYHTDPYQLVEESYS